MSSHKHGWHSYYQSTQLLELVWPALRDSTLLVAVELLQADGQLVPIADAFEREIEQTYTTDERTKTWTERQLVT